MYVYGLLHFSFFFLCLFTSFACFLFLGYLSFSGWFVGIPGVLHWIFVYMYSNYCLVCVLSTLIIYYVKAYIDTDSLCLKCIKQKHPDRPLSSRESLAQCILGRACIRVSGVYNLQPSLRSALLFHMLALERSSGSVYMDLIFPFGWKHLCHIFLAPATMMALVVHWVQFFRQDVCGSSLYSSHCLEV